MVLNKCNERIEELLQENKILKDDLESMEKQLVALTAKNNHLEPMKTMGSFSASTNDPRTTRTASHYGANTIIGEKPMRSSDNLSQPEEQKATTPRLSILKKFCS